MAGQRGHDDVEGVGRVAAVGSGIGQERDDPLEPGERAGPAVGEDEGEGERPHAALVDGVDLHPAHARHDLRQAVEPRLLGAPLAEGPCRPALDDDLREARWR